MHVLYFAVKSHVQTHCTEHYGWTTRQCIYSCLYLQLLIQLLIHNTCKILLDNQIIRKVNSILRLRLKQLTELKSTFFLIDSSNMLQLCLHKSLSWHYVLLNWRTIGKLSYVAVMHKICDVVQCDWTDQIQEFSLFSNRSVETFFQHANIYNNKYA